MSAVSTTDTTSANADNRRHLAAAVRDRRLELGTSVRAAAAQAGVARDTWIGLEEATRRTAEANYAAIERTLQWGPGSIVAVLGGGHPSVTGFSVGSTDVNAIPAPHTPGPATSMSPIRTHPADTALIKVMRSPDLSDEQKARIVRVLIADQERYAERRADELIEQARGEAP